MKIAICLSGQPRTWKLAKTSFLQFLENIKQNHPDCIIDTFIHAWNFNTKPNLSINHKDSRHPTEIYKDHSEIIDNDELEEILQFYSPKKYLFEDIDKSMSIIYNSMLGENPAPVGWTSSQFYSMQRAAFLKREYELEVGEEYDWCIRYRFDLDMNNSEYNIPYVTNLNNWAEQPSTSHNYVGKKYKKSTNIIYTVHSNFDDNHWPNYRVGDIFFISDSLTYDLICNFYDWLFSIPKNLFFNGVSPELVFCYYLNMLKIDIFSLPIDPKVIRE